MADVPKNNALERAAESAFMELLEARQGPQGYLPPARKV